MACSMPPKGGVSCVYCVRRLCMYGYAWRVPVCVVCVFTVCVCVCLLCVSVGAPT